MTNRSFYGNFPRVVIASLPNQTLPGRHSGKKQSIYSIHQNFLAWHKYLIVIVCCLGLCICIIKVSIYSRDVLYMEKRQNTLEFLLF